MVEHRIVPSKDEKYMGLALWIASFSKDPSTQIGAIIVGQGNIPLGIGYNGPPRKFDDKEIDWGRPQKYPYIVHAEKNAIEHSKSIVKGGTLYVTGLPCKDCMLDIVTAEIGEVIYIDLNKDPNSSLANQDTWQLTQDLARRGGVKLKRFDGTLNWMMKRMAELEQLGIF